MLLHDEIVDIIDLIRKNYQVVDEVEITLEANPDDLDKEYLRGLRKNTPVNRLSIGVQSFFDDDLEYLYRVHDGNQATLCIEESLLAGFSNITIDLIYGIPTLTVSKWKKNLDIFFSYNIPHLSSYSLTVEQKTALDVLIRKKKLSNINEQQSIEHFNILLEETSRHSYIHYEISNFAKQGFYSKHNSIYWLGDHYLGLGPSAHSYNGISRQWNVMNMKKYCENEPAGIVEEKEFLTKDQMYNEYVLTSLRTSWGCDIEHIENVFGKHFHDYFLSSIEQFVLEKKVTKRKNVYTLTNSGKLFADGISSALFYEP